MTANAWQVMVSKIIPATRMGSFYGFQSSTANLLTSGSAIAAGFLLDKLPYPYNYALCFGMAGAAIMFSLWFLSMTREPESTLAMENATRGMVWSSLKNFRSFLVVRMLSQLSVMGFSFYIVYAKFNFDMTQTQAGLLTGVLTIGQIVANPVMGWIGDKTSHTLVMKIGAIAAAASALIAWWAPHLGWFVLVFILASIANVALWTIGLAISLQFGQEQDRPVYIGLANTLVAPFTIFAPILGGWLADTFSYPTAFIASSICAVATAIVLHFFLNDPRSSKPQSQEIEFGSQP